MSDNVVKFNGLTKLELPCETVLDGAKEANLEVAIVVGKTQDGKLYFAGSTADLTEVLWWLTQAQRKTIEMGEP